MNEQYECTLEDHIETLQHQIGNLEDELEESYCKLDAAETIITQRDEMLLQILTEVRAAHHQRHNMTLLNVIQMIESIPSFNEVESDE